MQPYAVIKLKGREEQFTYDAPKEDGVSVPVACVVCGKDIETNEASWRNWDRHAHIGCAATVVGKLPEEE